MIVFLSASVPIPRSRDEKYYETADVTAIRDAVKALALYIAPRGRIVFGGHPAITPLVASIASRRFGHKRQPLILYQSAYFDGQFPPENEQIEDVRVTAMGADLPESLSIMRSKMLTEERFDAAVFIGGMNGVVEEYEALRKLQPRVPCFPVASTGAAALDIFRRFGPLPPELETELTYPTLFRRMLSRFEL